MPFRIGQPGRYVAASGSPGVSAQIYGNLSGHAGSERANIAYDDGTGSTLTRKRASSVALIEHGGTPPGPGDGGGFTPYFEADADEVAEAPAE